MLIWVVTGYMSGEWLSLNAGMTGFILITFFISTYRIIRMMNGNLEAFVLVGEKVMDRLRKVDQVAYVRFASVYRQFKDADTFMSELKKLLDTK